MLARRRRRLGTLSKRSEFSRTFNSDIRKENYLTAGHPQNTLHQLRYCLGSSRQSTKRMGLRSWANIFTSVHSQISDNKLFWNMIVPWTINYLKNIFSTWIWLKMKAPPPKPPTTTPIAKPCFSWNTNMKPQPHSEALLKMFSTWRTWKLTLFLGNQAIPKCMVGMRAMHWPKEPTNP